jgi:hypothetical protein
VLLYFIEKSTFFNKLTIMKRLFTIGLLICVVSGFAQGDSKGSFGVGLGFDYGGIGARIMGQPSKNFGIFGGVGYVVAGVGFNGGVQGIFNSKGRATGYVTAMYGYNAALKVTGMIQVNKIYYGPSFGLGVRLASRRNDINYWNFAILLPVRDPDFQRDIDGLNALGAKLSSVPPVGFSVGFNFGFRPKE